MARSVPVYGLETMTVSVSGTVNLTDWPNNNLTSQGNRGYANGTGAFTYYHEFAPGVSFSGNLIAKVQIPSWTAGSSSNYSFYGSPAVNIRAKGGTTSDANYSANATSCAVLLTSASITFKTVGGYKTGTATLSVTENNISYTQKLIRTDWYYTVTFVDGFGNTLKTQEVKSGGNATPPANPSKTNYTFNGWSGSYTNVTADTVVTANFTAYPTISISSSNTAMGTVLGGGQVAPGTSVTITAVPNSGYYFLGWSDGDKNPTRTIVASADKNLVAQFGSLVTITLVSNNTSMGQVFGGGQYVPGTEATITATINDTDNYHLVSWSDGSTELSRDIIVPHQDTIYTATFAWNQEMIFAHSVGGSVALMKNDNGWVVDSQNYGGGRGAPGSDVVVKAIPLEGYFFKQWEDGGNNAQRAFTYGDTGIVTHTATFGKILHLTYDANGGSSTPEPQEMNGSGYATLASAVSRANRVFQGWTVNGALYQAGANVYIEDDTVAVAKFNDITIVNSSRSVSSVSLFDVTANVKIADESGGRITANGVVGHVYRVDCVVNDATYKYDGFKKTGSQNFSNSFTFDGNDYEASATCSIKPVRSVTLVHEHGSVLAFSCSPSSMLVSKNGDTISFYDGAAVVVRLPDGVVLGYSVSSVTLRNLSTNDIYDLSKVDAAYQADRVTFDGEMVVNYTATEYLLESEIDDASSSAILNVHAEIDGSEVDTGVYGSTATFVAELEDGFVFGGWYDKLGNLVSSSSAYTVTVEGDIYLVAKAKAVVTFQKSGGDETTTLVVAGEPIEWGSSIEVTIGMSFEYELLLGEGWLLGGWSSNGVLVPLNETGIVTPTESMSMVATVQLSVNRDILVYIVKIGESSSSAVDKALVPNDTIAFTQTNLVPNGGDHLQNTPPPPPPFTAHFNRTTWVVVEAKDSVTFSGDSEPKSFFCFANSLPETGSVLPQGPSIVGKEPFCSVFLNSDTPRVLYAYYGTPRTVKTRLEYGNGSDFTMGSVSVVSSTDSDAVIAADGMSVDSMQGTMLGLSAVASNGYKFAGWYKTKDMIGEPQFGSNANIGDFQVNVERTIYAKFVKDANSVCEWEGDSVPKLAVWRSKTYESSKPFNPSAARVDSLGYRNDARNTFLTLTVDMFSAPDSAATASVRLENISSQNARRLPIARAERYMQIEVVSDVEVDAVLVGTSMGGLAT